MFDSPAYRLLAALASVFTLAAANAQVVVNEVHYHPVELEAFNADGTPVLDLTEDVHEFVEIRNAGASAVDISGWKLSGGIDYTFPASTSIAAGGYKVIARNPSRLQTVYGITGVLGPYAKTLGNNSDTVKLENGGGSTIDSVSYSSRFPWAQSADKLGANNDFLGFSVTPYQYKGRSLQRVSPTANSNDPANWVASPLGPGPTPGSANALTLVTPRPVVIAFSAIQSADESAVIRSAQPVAVTVTFSATNSLSNVQLEWFVDDIESFIEPRSTITMTALGNGQYTTSSPIPGQADRAIVRWRIKADRGAGVEVVSPRADDLAIVPVTATTKEAWHTYFVQPMRSSTRPIYDFFISTANDNQLNTNCSQNPRRVLSPDPPGYPRDEPVDGYYPPNGNYNPANYPAATAPHWDGVVPAIFVKDGVVHDILARYHGSRYQRSRDKNSWKFFTPSSRLIEGKQRFLITEKGNSTVLGFALFREAELLASSSQFVDFYRNNVGVTQRCEITDLDEENIKRYQDEQVARDPQNPPTFVNLGICYKAKGLDGDEGPYGWANGQPMPTRSIWTPLDRYIHSFPIQNEDWKGEAPFKTMIDQMWSARGDLASVSYNSTYGGQNHNNQVNVPVNLTNLRNYLNANWDVDNMLTYLSVRNWCSPWDDKFHNHYVYQNPSGKWTMLPWDFDGEMSGNDANTAAPTNSIFAGRKNDLAGSYSNNSRGPNWFKDSSLRAFESEFKQRMFILNNTLLTPANVQAIATAYGTTVPDVGWLTSRQNSINTQCGLGTWYAPATPTNLAPAHQSSALPPSNLQTSAYSHSNPTPRAHASTLWEIRASAGTFRAPVYRVKSTTNLTSLPIPFDVLNIGSTFFWRATYYDVDGHPSAASAETSFSFGPTPSTQLLIDIDAATTWRYNRTDLYSNTNSGPTDPAWWASTTFNDTAGNWQSGAALLGYEDAAIVEPIRTWFTSNGASNGTSQVARIPFYFRKKFQFPGSPVSATVRLRHIVDDGVVIYVNGVELPTSFRFNMNAGTVDSTTPASGVVGNADYSTWMSVPSSYFVQGENTIAAEVHQNSTGSSDAVFGLELEATIPFLNGDITMNEVLADNRSSATNGGKRPDYVEFFNNTFSPINIGGWSFTDNLLEPTKYTFPAGTTVPAQGYLTLWCDSDSTAPGLHSGFGLSGNGQIIALIQGNTVKDYLEFGPQAPDVALGRVTNGNGTWTAITPSLGAANVARTVGSVSGLRINEWMASPSSGDDWFELYNPDVNPVALGGLYLSDTPGDPTITQIPPLSFIAGKGYTVFQADGSDAGANHCNFKLGASGDNILLTAANGTTTLNLVTFGTQSTNVSQGRLPDGGAGAFVSFPQSPSRGGSNYLPAAVVINEVLANSASPSTDTVEIFNPTGSAANVGGWWLSDDEANLQKYRIPTNTTIAANGYLLLNESQFNPTPGSGNSFSLSSLGDDLYLSAVDGGGSLTGYRAQVRFGASAENVSFGRVTITGGAEFWPNTTLTFGAANAAPKTTPIIINEVMYHPVDSAPDVDNSRDEFIELHNITTSSVDVSGWRIKGDSDFTFPSGISIRPGDYFLVVSFDPANTSILTAFRNQYSLGSTARIYGPYSPKLSNGTQSVELAYPGPLTGGEIPYINVDKVEYLDVAPWPVSPDGTGHSLQRASRTVIGNDPGNWIGAAPTPTNSNSNQTPIADNDGDEMPNAWEDSNGFDKFSAADAALDFDWDGQSNLSEYVAGTDPKNNVSVLRPSVTRIIGGFRIQFTAQAGKTYAIQYRDSLETGNWQTLASVPAFPSTQTATYDDLTGAAQRFYRLSTSLP